MNRNRAVPPEGKVAYYRSDGTGRDTYIKQHNGGLLSQDRLHQLQQKKNLKEKNMKFGSATYNRHPTSYQFGGSNKFPHYVSDGSGRDFYVTLTQGGNSTPFQWRNQTDFMFKSTLRSHNPFPNINPEKEDTFMKTQSFPTKKQSQFRRTMSLYQSHLDRRLSQPKKQVKPPPISSYFDAKTQKFIYKRSN